MLRMDERLLSEELHRIARGQQGSSIVARFSERADQWEGLQDSQVRRQDGKGRGGERGTDGRGHQQHEVRPGLDRAERNRLKWEDYLLGLLLQNPALSEHVCGIINDGDFAGTDTRELYRIISAVYQRGSSPLPQPWEMAVPDALQETVRRVRKCVETRSSAETGHLIKEVKQGAFRLKRSRLLQSEMELRFLIREAKEAGDAAAERLLWHQVVITTRELRTIDSAIPLHN